MNLSLLPGDAHDERLLSHVHPADWTNPVPAAKYNLVVIGAGTAGLVTAAGAAGLGAKVALIERSLLGGDCLNVGCVPSKALLRAARAAQQVRSANQFGVHVPGGFTIDFPAMMDRVRKLRADISPHDSAARFRSLGIDVFLGDAQFREPHAVEVGGQVLTFHSAAITTGARAARPNIPGLAEAGFLTNETVFNLTELPRRLVVIGGGPIGCELAQAFARLGAHVTLVHNKARLLPKDDPDAGRLVEQALRREGVQIVFNATIQSVETQPYGKVLRLDQTLPSEVWCDSILVAAGRQPNVESLNLAAAGVEFDPRKGVTVNDRLQTSQSHIFAAGDVCSQYQFTHAADAMARIVIQNALFFGRKRLSRLTIPWCTYTDPEVAHVGMTVAAAEQQGIAIQTYLQELKRVDRAILEGDDEGFIKVHVKRGTDQMVGATVVASNAGDIIGELSLAMTHKLGLGKIASTIHPYPTQAEMVKKVGDAYNRTRLTPFVKKLFERWLAWRRS